MSGAMGSKKRRRKSGRPFIRLWRNVKRSEAYHGLSHTARAALIELLDRYNGLNNGMLGLGVRQLADELNCSKDTAARALLELDDAGLAHPVTGGVWKGKRATEWRLTFLRCDKTGELPVTNWKERAKCLTGETQDRSKVSPVRHKTAKCPTRETQNRKTPMNGSAKCPTHRTHIDIYHTPAGENGGVGDIPLADILEEEVKEMSETELVWPRSARKGGQRVERDAGGRRCD
jgi:hypothetical protein